MKHERPMVLCPLGFLELEPSALIGVAARAGFQGVVLRTRAALPGGPAYPMHLGDARFERTRAELDAQGVVVEAVEQIGLDRELDVASLRPMLEAAHALGAKRLICSGDDPEPAVIIEQFATLCDIVRPLGLEVGLEFMAFRHLKTLAAALDVVAKADRANGGVIVDALHLFRSGGSVAQVDAARHASIVEIQLSDAPRLPPPPDGIAAEARGSRLAPGEGELPLADLIACQPGASLSVEVPFGDARRDWPAQRRADLLAAACRQLVLGS